MIRMMRTHPVQSVSEPGSAISKGGALRCAALSLFLAMATGLAAMAEPPAAQAPGTASAPAGFSQTVDGCTFAITMVPFKGPKGEQLFVSTTEIPWELFDVFVYGSDKEAGKSNEKSDAVTKPTKVFSVCSTVSTTDQRTSRSIVRFPTSSSIAS